MDATGLSCTLLLLVFFSSENQEQKCHWRQLSKFLWEWNSRVPIFIGPLSKESRTKGFIHPEHTHYSAGPKQLHSGQWLFKNHWMLNDLESSTREDIGELCQMGPLKCLPLSSCLSQSQSETYSHIASDSASRASWPHIGWLVLSLAVTLMWWHSDLSLRSRHLSLCHRCFSKCVNYLMITKIVRRVNYGNWRRVSKLFCFCLL